MQWGSSKERSHIYSEAVYQAAARSPVRQRVDVVEPGGCDERVEGPGPTAAFVRAGEGPVAARPDRDGPQVAFGGVV
jgi:hypothetical protein